AEDWLAARERGIQRRAFEVDRRERHARLHAPLELQQRDLQIDRRRQVGLVVLEAPQFDDLPRFGPLRGTWAVHEGIVSRRKTEERRRNSGFRLPASFFRLLLFR